MSPFFIKHPIIAGVIAVVTTLLGLISMSALPISQYPDITPVTIAMSAAYPGANATEVAESVATPIELQLSGVEKMDYMNSTSSNNGSCSINVVFEAGSNPNTDQQNTYMRYSQATSQLPSMVSQMGITIKQSSGLPLMMYALDSPEGFFEPVSLTGYAFLNLVDPLKRVEGVGDVQVFGARFAVRIWLDTAPSPIIPSINLKASVSSYSLSLNSFQPSSISTKGIWKNASVLTVSAFSSMSLFLSFIRVISFSYH